MPIQWPTQYAPGATRVFVTNTLDMSATPDQLWAWLIRADLWPTFYVNASNVEMLSQPDGVLRPGTRFRWKTFGATIESTVLEHVPPQPATPARLAWDAKAIGIDAYHAWLLTPTATGASILTEETQNGWLAGLGNLLMPNRMHKFHQIWLESLTAKALTGPPPQLP